MTSQVLQKFIKFKEVFLTKIRGNLNKRSLANSSTNLLKNGDYFYLNSSLSQLNMYTRWEYDKSMEQ